MPWIEVLATFTWKPKSTVMRDLAPGVHNVTTRCAQAAVAAGKARRVKTPARAEVKP